MLTLGINAAFHDSSACIVRDGALVAAAEEERFTRIKHAKRPVPFSAYELPFHAIDYCLAKAGETIDGLDNVAYSFDPSILLKGKRKDETIDLPLESSAKGPVEGWSSPWDPLMLSHITNAPRHFLSAVPHHLERRWRNSARSKFKWHFVDHHVSHAVSAFFPSPFDSAAIMVLDGRGEQATTSYFSGQASLIEKIGEVTMPSSLGLLYEEITRHLGFLHSSDEYKVMALASFGKPVYKKEIESLIQMSDGGRYSIAGFKARDGLPPRRMRGEPIEGPHFDLAASLQKVLEETVLNLASWLYKETKQKNLCLAGGVALNCVMNSVIRDQGAFKDIWVQPAAGDAGTSLGAALWIDSLAGRRQKRFWRMHDAYLGPSFSDEEIERLLIWAKLSYRRLRDLPSETANLLAQDKIIGWFQGGMEFGPRALGARSILASPLHASMQERLNEIKDREDFRPVAPVVLEEKAAEWFDSGTPSSFMLFVCNVLPERKDRIPAVCHIDGTARIQTVNQGQNPLYYELIKAFERRTGVPILVNTSFNTKGEPIVCTPKDALNCFFTSPIDALVLGSFLLQKEGDAG